MIGSILYVLGGAFFGVFGFALIMGSSNSERETEAYRKGYEDGFEVGSRHEE